MYVPAKCAAPANGRNGMRILKIIAAFFAGAFFVASIWIVEENDLDPATALAALMAVFAVVLLRDAFKRGDD